MPNPFSPFNIKRALADSKITKMAISNYNVVYIGIIGTFSHLFYWFLWTYIRPQPNESVTIRIIGIITCSLLLTSKYWPLSLKRFFPLYWFLTLLFNLPFFFTVYLFSSNFMIFWSTSYIAMIFTTIMLIPNYVLLFINLILGTSLALLYCYVFIPETLHFNPELILFGILPASLFAFASGLVFSYSNAKGIASEERAKIFKSLAGSIAHELRNPLNAINLAQNQAGRLLSQSADINQNIKQQLTDINSSVSSSVTEANNTINIILSDLGNKPIEPSDFSYLSTDKILPEIIKTFGYRNLEEKEKVKLDVKDNFIFKAIDDRFTFIIYNLLKNALYYLNQYPNSIVTVGNEVKKIDGKEYNAIYVHDTGPGIPSHILPKLFGDFFTSGKKDGTGLGLAFCKRNMNIFNGDIIVESELGKEEKNGWTKFSLLFPKLSEEEITRAKTAAKIKKILIVDDQQVNLLTTKSRIEQNLANVICDLANNGIEAINLVKENKYHLILMDIQMPELNGIETTKSIRKSNKEIPIIAYTSLDHNLEEIKATTNDLLRKPVPDNILFRAISKWIINYQDDFSYLVTAEEYKVALKDKNILLADDQEMNRLMTKSNLESYGLKVTEVKDGKELLEIYHSNPNSFNLIITDINMPPYNGDEAAKEIRKTNQIIPIIALSGDGDKKDIYHFFKSGMTDYFIKGSNPELLIKIVANYLTEKKDELNTTTPLNDLNVSNNNLRVLNLSSDLQILDSKIIQSFEQSFREEILTLFFKDGQNLLTKIMVSKNNIKELFFHVHALKGILGNIGAEKLFEYVSEINSALKENKLPSDKNWFEQLELMYKELVEEIKALG